MHSSSLPNIESAILAIAEAIKNNEATGFIDASYENAWVRYDTTYRNAAYMRTSTGRVFIRGMIKGGVMNTDAFTVPEGFRPLERVLLATICNGAIGRVDILPTGEVRPLTGSSAWFSLDGLSWQAEQ